MDHIRRKFTRNAATDTVCHDDKADAQESELGDDSDAFELGCDREITLRLKLSDSSNSIGDVKTDTDHTPKEVELGSADEEVFVYDEKGQGCTVFEVVSTETVKEGRSTYVIYRILVTKNNKVDRMPCVLDKRFSDFEKLHANLRKAFPNLMDQFLFPRKQFTKNFTNETIALRSRAFEQYLSHAYSVDCIRFSDIFLEFFFLNDLKMAYNYLCQGDDLNSVKLFKIALPVQERIMGEFCTDIGATLCALVASCQLMENDDLALKYGISAVDCYSRNTDDKHYLPLLQACIHLCWKLGQDKQELEQKLKRLESDKNNIPTTLLAVVLEYAGNKLRCL